MRNIEYGKTSTSVMVVNREKVVATTPTVIWHYVYSYGTKLTIEYNYDCDENTIKNESFKVISKSEFDTIIKDIKEKNKVNFTIKLR